MESRIEPRPPNIGYRYAAVGHAVRARLGDSDVWRNLAHGACEPVDVPIPVLRGHVRPRFRAVLASVPTRTGDYVPEVGVYELCGILGSRGRSKSQQPVSHP